MITGAQICILKDNHIPFCALSSDELVQVSGKTSVVKKTLFQIAFRLHDNPSQTQHLPVSAVPNVYASGGALLGPTGAPHIVGMAPLMGAYGGYKGKGGTIINQIRQDSGAAIKVDSRTTEGDDCLITISAKEIFDEHHSPTMEAAVRLQPRCSDKVERDSGLVSFTTRLLVPTSQIGCLLGKGGNII